MFGSEMKGFRYPARRVGSVEELSRASDPDQIAAVVIEPIIQGAAGMKIWPPGTLRRLRDWCDAAGTLLIADEVMTGFGRTGKMFACEHEDVEPDLYVFAKGLTGGYLPLAITLVSHEVFEPFKRVDPAAIFSYGHSYTGNALGCAAALASLEIFRTENTLEALPQKIEMLRAGMAALGQLDGVAETRSCGLIGAIDLAGASRRAAQVCRAAREKGLLTRHIRNTVTFMPPLAVSEKHLEMALAILNEVIPIVFTEMQEPAARIPAARNDYGQIDPA
jgi:adenosylmethionine---8-amino-7-oxononanoate aminotransferase